MSVFDRVLSLVGLDFSMDLRGSPFSLIEDWLYLGGRPGPADVDGLREAGVTHVISCLPEAARAQMEFLEPYFERSFFPMHDGMHEDIATSFPELFRFAREVRAREPGALLVHCEVGVSRSATLVTALVMETERKRFFDAFSDVRSKRAQVLPNIGFAAQLQRFEHQLFPGARPDGPSSLARYLCERCNAPVDVALMDSALRGHDHDARRALEALFGGEIPRVVQGVRG